ncbi:non-ribosomal peptide synthetase, partial [Paenibacillus albidus]|uniref:non-ribosomal peptide synthetase n=1 Tax=Paenibacillus albidus TaxID=2041023 RepID=UPI00166BCC8C
MDAQIINIYRLTPMQEGMLFHSLLNPNSSAYYERVLLTLGGEIDEALFEKSFNHLIERHDVLRTVFLYKETEQPLQIVLDERKTSILHKDLSQLGGEEQNSIIADYMKADETKGFNLERDILIRMALFKLGNEQYKVVWSFHHIIMDGWCLSLLASELFRIYFGLKEDTTTVLPEVYPYSDYFTWLEKQGDDGFQYWENVLIDYDQQANFPTSRGPITNGEYDCQNYSFKLDEGLTRQLERLAADQRTTLNNVFQAVWGIVLQRYNRTNDVVFGSVVSGRVPEVRGIENMIGLFINTVPIRITSNEQQSFVELLEEVHHSVVNANRISYLPLADIQSRTSLKNGLIQHIIAFENYPIEEIVGKSDANVNLTILDSEVSEHTNYDLEVVVFPAKEMEIVFRYNGLLYDKALFMRIEGHLKQIIQQVLYNSDILVKDIDVITEQERAQMLHDFNHEATSYPMDKTLHQLFEEQTLKTPNNIAVTFEDSQMNYEQLNCRANQLARVLQFKGVKTDELVGIVMDRSIEMIISILAILKSGAAYLPIDPSYPDERIRYMLDESGCRFLLIQEPLIDQKLFAGEQINLNDPGLNAWEMNNLELVIRPSDLAYVIFTSGSTGKPKGVMIEHRNVVQLMKHTNSPFDFSERDVWTMFHSYCFDFSVWEMYGALLHGGELVIVPKITAQDTRTFLELVRSHGVTVLNQTPTAFYQFIREAMEEGSSEIGLRYVIFGGEALNPIMLNEWKKRYPSTKLVNMYGITETTVHVTYKEIGEIETDMNVSNIGRPLLTLKSFILGSGGNLLPIGVAGELYISGAGLARGYMNNPQMTDERFVENPFESGTKMYRTGDLARWLPDGNLEYLGRIDHQVKIRGYRIELGEIEKVLARHEHIEEAIVMASYDQNQLPYLCAYYISGESLNAQDIRKYLSEFLPDYMIPSSFVHMDKIPLNQNGKVDRKALPEPESGFNTEEGYVAPQHSTEKKLAEIWQEILGVPRVGLRDHFFGLGGHSLKAVTLVSRVSKELQVNLSLGDVFKAPILSEMATLIRASEVGIYAAIEQVPKAE